MDLPSVGFILVAPLAGVYFAAGLPGCGVFFPQGSTTLFSDPLGTSSTPAHRVEDQFRQFEKAGPENMPSSPPSGATRDPVPVDHGDFVDSEHEGDIEDEAEDSLKYL
ncbi:hypothetical protein DHEL01_v209932 [Diaporthe helianthi]|uniref:Uncharacterized protein n=1 Tax=Diaporthe helianthi TaxID=158607 RepID=A0A2P5HN36_DIAHE|nr:hypothetical protein DHEL01_v209932 [Diaporthe helianthi]